MEDNLFYIFGYGSLVWRPAFEHKVKFDGYVKNYKRRFWQSSTDHRGTESFPGRVVTLIPKSNTEEDENVQTEFLVWGKIYGIDPNKKEEVLNYLDVREKGGYEQSTVEIFGKDNQFICRALLYVGNDSNSNYSGFEKLQATAEIIHKSTGPSGKNTEYLFNLANALREMNVEEIDKLESHIFDLEKLVLNLNDKHSN